MQLRISTNTNLTAFSRDGKRTMDALIPIYAGSGYSFLDLNFCEMMNPGSVLNTANAESYIWTLKSQKTIYALEYIQAHAPYPRDYLSLSEEERRLSDEGIIRSMRWAAELGIPHIVVHPIKGSIDDNIRYFTALIEKQQKPIRIAIENMETRSEIWKADDLLAIASSLKPAAGLCLDTGHAHIAGEDIPAFIEKAGEMLIGTHIADNNGREDQHLLPGFGTIEWERVIPALKANYSGFLNYECMYFNRHLPQTLTEDVIKLSLAVGEWLLSL